MTRKVANSLTRSLAHAHNLVGSGRLIERQDGAHMVAAFGQREVGWRAVDDGGVHVLHFAQVQFLLGYLDFLRLALAVVEYQVAVMLSHSG
jgi:hypothetical protein